jgi:signal transduction histidine kinase
MNPFSPFKSLRDRLSSLREGKFPVTAFVAIVVAVCLGLLLSSIHSYITLSRLRIQYLHNRGMEVASALDAQVRGPGRRNNPAYWQGALRESLERNQSEVAFLALLGRDGEILAAAGGASAAAGVPAESFATIHGRRIFVSDFPLATPRPSLQGAGFHQAGWHLRLGLDAAAADFIRTQAIVHVAVTIVAVIALAALSYYLLLTMARFIELKAREESQRHLKALGSMSATLAHEIRNPLGAMKGLTQLAQEQIPGDHQTQELMKTVIAEAERLEKLVTSLLRFARPRAPQLSEFDARQVVSEVHEMLRHRMAEQKIAFSVESGSQPLIIRSDPDGLRQVLLNVLLNAMEATPQGGRVSLKARPDRRSGRLQVEVDDTGPGLPAVDTEELFQPFITTKTQGTGLGLAVTRRIVEDLGGEVQLSNLPGGGAQCLIRLPLDSSGSTVRPPA